MGKIKETVATLLLAARYSLSFCWRNSRGETIGRLVISASTTLLIYFTIQSTGLIINAVQKLMAEGRGRSFGEIAQEGLFLPVIFLLGVLLFGVVLGRFNWYYRSKWNQTLRFANQRELNDHRGTLDVARFRSKEYDDLSKRIDELPWSWQTRIAFSEEMFSLLTTVISFVLFGASLLWYKPVYALVLVLAALPMMVAEFRMVAMWWNLFQELVPHNKKRHVLEKPYRGPNAFVQALMFNQMPALRRDIDINVGSVLDAYNALRKDNLRREMVTHLLAVSGLCAVVVHVT